MRGLFRDKTKAEAFNVFRFLSLPWGGYSGDTIIFGDEEKGEKVQEFMPVVL